MGELRKHLFGRYRFPAISLGNGKEQLCLLFGRKLKAAIIVFGEDRHRGTFLQGDTFKNDLSANHFSGCHFHIREDTPIRVALRRDAQRIIGTSPSRKRHRGAKIEFRMFNLNQEGKS